MNTLEAQAGREATDRDNTSNRHPLNRGLVSLIAGRFAVLIFLVNVTCRYLDLRITLRGRKL